MATCAELENLREAWARVEEESRKIGVRTSHSCQFMLWTQAEPVPIYACRICGRPMIETDLGRREPGEYIPGSVCD